MGAMTQPPIRRDGRQGRPGPVPAGRESREGTVTPMGDVFPLRLGDQESGFLQGLDGVRAALAPA